LTETEADIAIKKLEQLNFIQKGKTDGNWKKTDALLLLEYQITSLAAQKYHQNILKIASKAIHQQPIENRKILSSVFSMKKENLPDFRKDLDDFNAFNARMLEKYMLESSGDCVYVMGLQLFQLNWD
jgi:uncharacterized protein (TIGR02147 family)